MVNGKQKKGWVLRITGITALCIVCFCLGVILFGGFRMLVESLEGVQIRASGGSGEYIENWFCLLLFTFLPLIFIGFWRFTPLFSTRKKVLTIFIFIICFLFYFGVRFALIVRGVQLQKRSLPSSTPYPMPTLIYPENFHLWLYLVLAMTTTGLSVYFLLREENEEVASLSFDTEAKL